MSAHLSEPAKAPSVDEMAAQSGAGLPPAIHAAEAGLSTGEVERRLFAKYHGNDFAICMDVRNAAGFNASRSADALGVGLWPSRGCHVHGFEIKTSRADWLRELKDGAKAEAFHRYCDFWHLVVGDKAIVREGELPEGWGLLVPHGDSLREIVAPVKIAAEPMPRSMLAAFIKRASNQAPLEATLKQRYDDGKKRGIEEGERRAQNKSHVGDGPKYAALRAAVDKFKKDTGIDPEWMYGATAAAELKTAAALVRAGHVGVETRRRLKGASRDLATIVASLDRAASDLAEAPTP